MKPLEANRSFVPTFDQEYRELLEKRAYGFRTIFEMLESNHEALYPSGLFFCHRQTSWHISSRLRLALQPRICCARSGQA
jgi:hypothetical protein